MKRRLLVLSAALAVVMAGCSGGRAGEASEAAASGHEGHETESPTPAASPEQKTEYTLDASVEKRGDGYYLMIETNLKLSEENYGRAAVEGEGHIHFYLNGSLKGPITDDAPFLLEGLEEGENKIRLVLAHNNHSVSYGVSKELTVEAEQIS